MCTTAPIGEVDISAAAAGTRARETDSIGREFAREYYDAFAAKTGAPGLDRFHDDRSTHVFIRHWRLADYAVRGADAIGRFVARMHRRPGGGGRGGRDDDDDGWCTVDIGSVDTVQVRPRRFAVLAVGKLTRPGDLHHHQHHQKHHPQQRVFVQCTVVKYAWSAENKFSVVGTVFKFDDDIIDDLVDYDDDVPASVPESVPGDSAAAGGVTGSDRRRRGTRVTAVTAAARLYVGGLTAAVTADDLTATFGRFGTLAGVSVHHSTKKKAGGVPERRHFGIVQFEDTAVVDAVAEYGTVPLANGDRAIVEKSVRPR